MGAHRDLRPELQPGRYVFVSVPLGVPLGLAPVVTVSEAEGLTLVVPQEQADDAGLGYDFVAAWITLGIESTLDEVGLTAAFATRLAAAGISCNVVAGLHHDHLFVPHERAGEAVALLASLSRG